MKAYNFIRINQFTRLLALSLLSVLFFSKVAVAQDTEGKALQAYSNFIGKLVVPPSPEAASLGKYGNSDVNYYTGSMSLSIPIHSIGGREISLPISLSYDGSGNRVEQIPSMVGLGWALSAGGVITRSVRGNPDKSNNYFDKASVIGQTTLSDPIMERDHLQDIARGVVETQPDEYFFNFGGMSGKFHINPYGTVYMRKQQDLVITPYISNGGVNDFIVKDSRGNKYYFTAAESTYLALDDDYGVIPSSSLTHNYNSSWFLTKVESANSTETIDLEYTTETAAYTMPVNTDQYQSATYSQCGNNAPVSENFSNGGVSTTQVSNRRFISKIIYKLGTDVIQTVKFETSTSTKPYASRELNRIRIYNSVEGEMGANQFDFIYDGSTNRLTLKSVQEKSLANPSEVKNPHTFVYNTAQLPAPTSNSIDHWGFYNGSSNPNSLIPSAVVSCTGYVYPGGYANRETDPSLVKAGVMTRINYPTGGYSEFEYEAHSAININSCTPNVENFVGGLRLKSSKNYESNGQVLTNKSYNYVIQGSTTTSGSLNTTIGYTSSSTRSTYAGQCFETGLPLTPNSECGKPPVVNCNILTISPSNRAPLGVDDGSHIKYSRVEEIIPGAGKTVYHYTGEDLTKKEIYSETGILVAETLYEYTSDGRNKSWFGYTATPESEQDNRNQYVFAADGSYFWKKEGNDTRTWLNAPPYTPYQQSRIYKTKFYRKGYILQSEWKQSSKITDKQYFNGNLSNVISKVTDLIYANKNISQPTQTLTTNSNNIINKVQNYFPHDLQNDAVHPLAGAMITKNMIGIPLRTEIYVNNTIVNAQEMVYSSFATNQLLPQYIRGRYRNGTWETIFTVNNYNAVGLPTQTTGKGFSASTTYTWAKNLLLSKTFGSSSPNILTWKYSYGYPNILESLTDENGLKKKFTYDGLQRLIKVDDRMKPDGTDIQATTNYTYQYKNASNPYSFVGTTSTFKGVSIPLITKQYMDGLGRPIEVVKEGYTPSNQHQKSYVSYDALGRQNKTFLPFESSTLGVELPSANMSSFVLTEFEASPLSRPIRQTNVDNSIVTTSYGTNVAYEVRLLTVNASGGASSPTTTYYAANTLFKTTVTDENGKQTSIFKDKLGRVILTRKTLSGQNIDTYNVYDDYGQLVAVLPPASIDASGNINDALTFQYKYDNQNRLMEKKVPGAAVQKFYYDNRNLMVLAQDGNMRTEAKYLATLYDDLGRVVKTGFAYVSPTQGQNFNLVDAHISMRLTETQYYRRDATSGLISATGTLSSSWIKHQGAKVLHPTNPNSTDFMWSYVERRAGLEYTGNPVWSGKQHLINGALPNRPILDSDNYGVDWSVTAYNGMQQPDYSIRYLFAGSSANEVRTRQDFVYDNGRRMTHSNYAYTLNTAPLPPSATFTLSNMVYNFKDQLTEKNIGYQSPTQALQSIDYSYNLRGWLTAINNVNTYITYNPIYTPSSTGTGAIQNLAIMPLVNKALNNAVIPFKQEALEDIPPPVADNNTDLFSQNIYYSGADSRFQAASQGNGNIQAVTWQVAGRAAQGYGFTYDDLDRLTNAKYFDLTNSANTTNFSTDYKFNESQAYDLRGNITSLQRNGLNSGAWTSNGYTAATYGMIDNLTYNYNNQNQLMKVVDASLANKGFIYKTASVSEAYAYDQNGNLIKDLNKGITSIEYNYLNLPIKIVFNRTFLTSIDNGSLEFTYDALGAKLRKVTKNVSGSILETVDYINGVEYKNNVLQRFAHTEGAVVRQADGSFTHEYVLRDHLGNTRVTFSDANNDGLVTTTDIKQINHFYPFGLNMEGDWNGAAGNNKYQYNEKEWNDDFGLGWNDYGARFYDPAVARWLLLDPLAEKYHNQSPYSYVHNTPINAIDPDGRLVIFINGQHASSRDFSLPGYWGGFADQVKTQLKDKHDQYYDGALGGWASGLVGFTGLGNQFFSVSRYSAGKEKGYEDAAYLIANLARDTKGNIVETIKIITHSMGGVFGAGFQDGLKRYLKEHPELAAQVRITLVAHFDPYQGGTITADSDIYTMQFLHRNSENREDSDNLGWLANERVKGADYFVEDNKEAAHAVSTFVKNISSLEEGTYKWDGSKFVCTSCK